MPTNHPSEANLGLIVGTVGILFTAFILADLWQTVFGWLLFMLLLLAVANALHNSVRLSAYGSLTGRVIASATASLRDGIACVTLGVAIVVVAQLGFWIVDRVSPDAVRAAEVWLSSARGAMERVISLRNLLIAIAAATVLALLIPQSWALSRFSRARDIAAAVYLVLLTVTSFTFFSAVGVAKGEMNWNAKLRTDLNETLEKRDRAFAEAAGAAWTEQKLRELSEDEQTAVQAFFALAPEEVRRKLPRVKANLAHAAEGVDRAERPARPSATEQAFRARSWSGPETSSGYPTMSELAALAREAEAETARHRTLREAAVTAAAAALSELVPGHDGGVAQELVKSLAEAVGTRIAEAAMPDVATLDQLRSWVRGVLSKRQAEPPETATAGKAVKPEVLTLDQLRDMLRGSREKSSPQPAKAASWIWQRADFELDHSQLSRRVAQDVDRLRKWLTEERNRLAAIDIERIGDPFFDEQSRGLVSKETLDKIEATLEQLLAEAPFSSESIARLSTELWAMKRRGGLVTGPVGPLIKSIESRPRPPVRPK
jgi:hypothetical protein